MGIQIMPRRGAEWFARILGIDTRAYSAKRVVEDAYARVNERPSPDLKIAYLAYKNAEKARERKNRPS